MITSPASGLSSRLAPILCSVAALLYPGTPTLAGTGNPEIPTCNASAGDAAFGVAVQATERRDLRGGVDPVQGCPWVEVPEPLPLALLGLGLIAAASMRLRLQPRVAKDAVDNRHALSNVG